MNIRAVALVMILGSVLVITPSYNAQGMLMDTSMGMMNQDVTISILDMNLTAIDDNTNRVSFVLPIDRHDGDTDVMMLYPVLIVEDGSTYTQCGGVTAEIHLEDDGIVGLCIDIDEGTIPHTIALTDSDGNVVCLADIRDAFESTLGIQVIVYNSQYNQLLFVFDNEIDALAIDNITLYAQDGTVISLEGTGGMYADNVAWYHLEIDDVEEMYVDIRFNGILCDALFMGSYNVQVVMV